jgi:hypothetical protein
MTTSISHVLEFALDLLGQVLAHFQAGGVDRGAVDDRIRTGQVDELEHARVQRWIVGALARCAVACRCIDEDRFARRDVAHEAEAHAFQRHRFGGDQVFGALLGFVDAQAQRTDAERIAEGQQADAGDLRHGGVTTAHAAVQHGHGFKDRVGVDRDAGGGFLDFMGQHVQQHFRIGIGVDVAAVVLEHLLLELFPVGQVAVVRQRDAERRVDVERLRFFLARRTGGWIAAVADTGIALQRTHVTGAEHVAHQAVGLVHGEHAAVIGRDTRCILAAVLQQQQRVIQQLIDRLMGNDADDATHDGAPGLGRQIKTLI